MVEPYSAHAVQVLKDEVPRRSFLGGVPTTHAAIEWPRKNRRPLSFLGQLDLSELAGVHQLGWLPGEGALLFFYDLEEQPWGFDPADVGGWRVIYVDATRLDGCDVAAPRDLSDRQILKKHFVSYRRIRTLPSLERNEVEALALTKEEHERLLELQSFEYGGGPRHQLGGFPSPVQGDQMELEAQLAANGIYCGDSSYRENPRAQALAAGAEEWRLLLQVDSDGDLGACWGDVGTLYFWIREADARARSFEQTWLILQCS